jgi:mRNA interferase MazF
MVMAKEPSASQPSRFSQGDIIDLDLDPRTGHEQSGCRPALVISRDLFNARSGLLVVCPITNTDRRSPFHISLGCSLKTTGFVMCDQVRTINPAAKNAGYREHVSKELLIEVSDTITGIIEVL